MTAARSLSPPVSTTCNSSMVLPEIEEGSVFNHHHNHNNSSPRGDLLNSIDVDDDGHIIHSTTGRRPSLHNQSPHHQNRTKSFRERAQKAQKQEEKEAHLGALSFFKMLDGWTDCFVSVELTKLWRRHLVYGKRNGKELIALFMQRFASLTTMTTLLIGTEVAVLFSPSEPAQRSRDAIRNLEYTTVEFWAQLALMASICASVAALLAVVTAWALNAAISPSNAHIVLRSSLWLHAATLPAQLALLGIKLFVTTLSLYFFVICAWQIAVPIVVIWVIFLLYIISLYSATGRIILHSGAIGEERIVERNVEYELTPQQLTTTLLEKSWLAKQARIHVREQYRIRYQKQLGVLEEGGDLRLEEFRLPRHEYLGSEYASKDRDIGTMDIGDDNDDVENPSFEKDD